MTNQTKNVAPATPKRGDRPADTYPRRSAARIAGVSYLVMFVLAIFANFAVREQLIEPGNGEATVANITGSLGLFRLGLVAFLAIFVLDVVIAWALHVVFRSVNRDLSLVTAWFRIVYTALLGVALVSMFQVLQILGGESLAFLTGEQVSTQTMIELSSFESTWLIGLVAFGIHLALLGVLIVRSGLVTKALGLVLIAAGVAYVLDTLARGMLADYESVAGILLVVVALPSMVGEGWLGLWLLFSKRLAD
ncbi:MAG: DUF4386 domain-containing protein [Acidimicrobiia bacterium]